ncbi:MAG: response regulator transcription factor [Geothrix sp.]|uniref:response regulator transcription factor n=1 Tax=Geothrix sp. TaxID=1962974 RepID=UPI003BAFABFC
MDLHTPCEPEVRAPGASAALPRNPGCAPWTSAANSLGTALVVEDDPGARNYIRSILRKAGFKVLVAGCGEEALDLFTSQSPRLVLLDIGLPGMDGFEVCRMMRGLREDVAILILTGRGDDSDKVWGLDLGADDYLVKPFAPDVLVARTKAVLRRCSRQFLTSDVLTLGDIRMEVHSLKVFKGDREVDLTPREFALLGAFLKHPGEVLTRDRLHREVWGENHHGSAKALDVFVCKLREKLEDDPAHPKHFRTEWGVGFICR